MITRIFLLMACHFLAITMMMGQENPRAGDVWQQKMYSDIDYRAKISGFNRLDPVLQTAGRTELRFWIIPATGVDKVEGYIVVRDSGKCYGFHILPGKYFLTPIGDILKYVFKLEIGKKYEVTSFKPNTTWEGFWSKVLDYGVRTLPGDTVFRGYKGSDGTEYWGYKGDAYFIEYRESNFYRTYYYLNLKYYHDPDTMQMMKIIELFKK